MPRFDVPSCPRAWSRVAVLTLIGVAAAGCSNSARFVSSADTPSKPETTASVYSQPAAGARVDAQPLPTLSRPATVAASNGVASGAPGLGAYRPARTEITGSVAARKEPAGHWTWDGGSPVTVRHGDTVESIGRKYGVPASAIRQVNGISKSGALRPGQRVVIPRYVTAGAPRAPHPAAQTADNVHIVQPGETLLGIAHKHRVSLSALARANHMQPFGKISIGDRLTIPGGRHLAERQTTPPQIAQPRTVAPERVAAAPVQNVRVVTPEPQSTETVTHTAEAAGGMPSFRWPVKGRVIVGFGPRPNGTQNDGINLAVPEGTPIKAADDGVVAYAGNELKGYGNLVLIRHSNGFVSAYANASDLTVKRGDSIKRGQVIAHAGQTGNVTSPQLHFEIRKGATPVDPLKYLGGA
jgi:murein DD-endopeptidase MepM/ murein hydrolase activator NlpD